MKKTLIIFSFISSGFLLSQTNCEDLKAKVSNLETEINTVKTENNYLKKVLEINNPVKEIDKEKTSFKILNLVGDKTKKTISLTMLLESKDENTNISIQELSLIDLEGNEYTVKKFEKIEGLMAGTFATLTLNVPKKITPVFVDVESLTQIAKLLRIKIYSTKESEKDKFAKTLILEFRDLKVNWQ